MRRQGLIDMWYNSMISAGSNANDILQFHMRTADIIVLLISADFFDSDQCFNVEMQYAFEQRTTRSAPIIPVILRPADWRGFSLEQFSPLPQNGEAVSVWSNLDKALTEVVKGIRRVAEEIASSFTDPHPPAKPPQFPLYILPYESHPFFTDREEILAALHLYFTSEPTSQVRTQALYGLGGVGKTLLAIKYAYLHQHEYQAILWLNTESHELLLSDMLSLTDKLGIPLRNDADEQQRFAAIKQWLQRHDQWLLVLDNLDDFTILGRLIPRRSNGHVLLITHSQATGPFVTNTIPVTPMTIDEGALLLLRRARLIPAQGSRHDAADEDYLQALVIAQELEGYPLALDQAGAYIEETKLTPASYLSRYREHQALLLGMRGRLTNDHPDPVTTTFTLTFEKIAQINPDALELLKFLAFLSPDALPDEMIRNGAASLTGHLHTVLAHPIILDQAIGTLLRYSLVHHSADTTTLNMHRIIQTLLKHDLTKKQQHQLASQAVRLINASFPEVRFATWEACERYVPQAQHCATLIRDYQLTLKEGGLLLERLGSYYAQRGCSTEAETYLTQALHLQEQLRRGNPLDTAQTLNTLGLLYQRRARYQEAEAIHQRALNIREQMLGPEHPKTAESLHNLAMLYGNLREYQRAEQLYLRVLSLEELAKGPDHRDVASTLNNLGLIYYHQERYQEAEAAYQRGLAIYEQHFSPSIHPDLIYPLDGLGNLAEQRGDYQQAEALYLRALSICEQTLGDEHIETAHCLNKLADIAELSGNDQKAEALYLRALAIGEQTEHSDVALFLNNLAFLASKQKQYQRAEELYQRSLNIYKRTLGPEHPDVIEVLDNLEQLRKKARNNNP